MMHEAEKSVAECFPTSFRVVSRCMVLCCAIMCHVGFSVAQCCQVSVYKLVPSLHRCISSRCLHHLSSHKCFRPVSATIQNTEPLDMATGLFSRGLE